MTESRFLKISLLVGGFLTLPLFSGCNVFSGIDTPKSDPQLLAAARACLDRGDYVCAKERYNALSDNLKDTRLSELAFTTMAENHAFSISDLVSSLGDDRGGSKSFALLSEVIAARGKTDGATRAVLQASYASVASIQNPDLKAFMQFITALATFNQVLSSAVGADGKLTADDLVNSPASCKSVDCTNPMVNAPCQAPSQTDLNNTTAGDINTSNGMDTATGWNTPASLLKLQQSAAAAADALAQLSGSNDFKGILDTMDQLNQLLGPAALPECRRQAVLNVLFP